MNKLFKKIATAVVGMAMAIGVGVAVGHGEVQKASAGVSSTPTWSSGSPDFGTSYASNTFELNGVNWFASCAGNTTSIGWNSSKQGANNNASSAPLSTISENTKYGMYQTSGGWKVEKIVISISNSLDSVTGSYYIWYSTNNGTSWTQAVKGELADSTTTLTYDHGSNIGDSVRFAFGFGTSKTTKTRINLSNIQVYAEVQAQEITGISVGNLAVHSGESKQAQVTCVPDGSSLPSDVAYASSNPQVFTVNSSGLVTGVAAGTATLTVSSASKSLSETGTVTVSDYPLSGIQVGKQYALTGAETKMELTGVEEVNNNSIGIISEYEDNPSYAHLVSVENGSRTGTVALKINDEYLAWSSGNTLSVASSVSDESSWVVTYEDDAYTVINLPTFETGSERYLKLNVQNQRFACYLSGQENVFFHLYESTPAPTMWTVTFAANGGSKTMEPAEVENGQQYTLPECGFDAPEGKEFEAWAVSSDATKTYQPGDKITVEADITVTAQWKDKEVVPPQPAQYTITFNGSGAEGSMNPLVKDEGSSIAEAPANGFTVPQGKEFDGWKDKDGNAIVFPYTVNADATFYASWKDVEVPPQPGEEVVYNKVSSNQADFTGRYLIVYEAGEVAFDGSLDTLDAVSDIKEIKIANNSISLEESKNNFYFDIAAMENGYSIKSANGTYIGGASGSNKIVESSTALLNSITVSEENADIESATSHLRFNSDSNQPRFRYYKSSSYTAQLNIQLYKLAGGDPAPTTYSVNFNSGAHGTGDMAAVTGVSGEYTLPANGFTANDGWKFAGWTVDNNTELKQPGDKITVSADVILTAQWVEDTTPVTTQYTITFDKGQGSGSMEPLTKDAGAVIAEAPECKFVAPENQEFDKWLDVTGAPIEFPYTVNADATFYASYKAKATPQPAETVTDTITAAFIGNTPDKTSDNTDKDVHYEEFQGKVGTSGAEYAGNSRGGYNNTMIQLRSNNNNSGIVTTKSAGKVKSITINFNAQTGVGVTTDRIISVYGANSAYTAATNLYAATTQGDLIGEAKFVATALSVKLDVESSYQFIGLRSKSGTSYLTSVEVEWEKGSGPVVIDPTDITLNKTQASIAVGGTVTLTATLKPSGAQGEISWSSSDSSVASVDKGVVTGVKEGTATITATCGNLHAECAVTVSAQGVPAHAGTIQDPKTVAEALEIAEAAGGTAGEAMYFTGKVKEKAAKLGSSNDMNNVKIADDDGNEILIYYLKKSETATKDNGLNWESVDDLKVGDVLIIKGAPFTYNNTTPEFGSGTFVYSINGVPTPTEEQGGGGEGGDTPTPSGKTLVGIEITVPTKTDYFIGENFDPTGLEVRAVYSDGSKVVIDLSKIGSITVDTSTKGEKVITITYEGKSASFTIDVTGHNLDVHDGCHASILASSALISITTLIGAGLLMMRKRKED